MSNRWFRHYAGMMRDEKLVRAAVFCGQPVERVVWIWGAILESAAEINDAGRYDFDAAEAAYFLRADMADISAVVDALAGTGRLAENCVVHWSDRQFESDRSASRQAAYRERKRRGRHNADGEKDAGDSAVTSLSRHGDAPETDTDTDSVATATGELGSPKTLDPKTLLFREGLATLAKLTGRKPDALRPVVGRWMRLTGDDAGALLAEIERCRGSPVADPISSIEARLKPREPNGKPRRVTNAEQSAAAMAWALDRVNGRDEREAISAEPDHGDEADVGRGRNAPPARARAVGHRPD